MEKDIVYLPLFSLPAGRPPSLPPTRTHAKICVLHVVETTCLSPLSPLSLSVVKVEKSWVVLLI